MITELMMQRSITSLNVSGTTISRKKAGWGAKFFLAPCFCGRVCTISWEQRKLGEVTESIKNGYSYKADGSRDHTYKITRIESISTGVINTDKLGSSDEINESYRLQDGDILFSHINSLQYIANTAIYTSILGKIYHGMNLLNIRAKSNLINSHFLLHLLKIESNRDWFRTVAKPAVNQASISTTEVGAFEFLLPNLKEQQVIADYFDKLDSLITLHQREAMNKGHDNI